jgi:hypothetical protein
VNGFFCALHKTARLQSGAAVVAWWSERRCAAEWGELVRPDAYGIWEQDGRQVEFFLEHDTGTEALPRVAAKLDGYRDLADADGIARPVLFWLTKPAREPGLRRALGKTALPVFTAVAGADSPAEPLWLPLREEGPRRRLIELEALGESAGR